MGHEILSEEKNCERWYQEELNKPLEEIKEDLFFRALLKKNGMRMFCSTQELGFASQRRNMWKRFRKH